MESITVKFKVDVTAVLKVSEIEMEGYGIDKANNFIKVKAGLLEGLCDAIGQDEDTMVNLTEFEVIENE